MHAQFLGDLAMPSSSILCSPVTPTSVTHIFASCVSEVRDPAGIELFLDVDIAMKRTPVEGVDGNDGLWNEH